MATAANSTDARAQFITRRALEARIDELIDLLDEIDADDEREEDAGDEPEDEDEHGTDLDRGEEDVADFEPSFSASNVDPDDPSTVSQIGWGEGSEEDAFPIPYERRGAARRIAFAAEQGLNRMRFGTRRCADPDTLVIVSCGQAKMVPVLPMRFIGRR